MRTIIHLSDLHFGRDEKKPTADLLAIISKLKPDIIVVSGDLTQRATTAQFRSAGEFLSHFNKPLLILPGNHDISLYALWNRFIAPYRKYKRFIDKALDPRYSDEEVAILGLNSVRASRFKDGRVNSKQLAQAKEWLASVPKKAVKIIFSHHPFNLPSTASARPLARAKKALRALEENEVDIFLSGHLHRTSVGHGESAYKIAAGHIFIQAGTAISKRRRGEANAFNVLSLNFPHLKIEVFAHDGNNFFCTQVKNFFHTGKGWKLE